MEMDLDVPEIRQGDILSGAGPEVFVNANTITKWLLSQPENRLEIAKSIWSKLLKEASQLQPNSGNGHACVKLCGFVQQCAKSNDAALKEWAFSEDLSRVLFQFYLESYEHDPHRALRLVLDLLVMSSTSNPCSQGGRSLKEHILETLVAIVARQSGRLLTKAGLQCLDHFLTKQAITLDDIAHKYREIQPLVADLSDISLWRSFVFHLFSWMELSSVCPIAGKCIVHIFRGLNNPASNPTASDSEAFTVEVFQRWLEDAVTENPAILEDIKNYVLMAIFKNDKPAALRLLEIFASKESLTSINGEVSDQTLMLQLAALELGKKCGLVEEPNNAGQITQSTKQIILQESVLDYLLIHPSLSVRSSAFSLLVSCQATTKPFSQVTFNLLKSHLSALHADYDAKFRNELLGLTKFLIRRVKNVITVAERSLAGAASRKNQQSALDGAGPMPRKKFGPEAALIDDAEAEDVLERHEKFLRWYMAFLKGELVPTASYQRHITAARAALLVLKVGKHAGLVVEDSIDTDTAKLIADDFTWIRLLLDLMLDPFDDVRETAQTLLSLLPREVVGVQRFFKQDACDLLDILQPFCARAHALATRTGRADHGDGAARSQGLLCKWLGDKSSQISLISKVIQDLEAKISKAERDLGHAAIENPVHADFAALSYIWQVLVQESYSDSQLEELHRIQHRIFDCSKRIWLAVKHVLCDDSPEGHLPEELEEIEGLDTKDLLSYSFRAVHESSNLLRLVVGSLRLPPTEGVLFPTLDVFRSTGNLAFEQLSNLRHRGAFSTVSLTFTTCCQLTQNLRAVFPAVADPDDLLREWYQGAKACITTQASTTRRSAGIPSLISAILAANAKSPSMNEVFLALTEIAQVPVRQSETDGSNLPQVHALNCLRDIFRSSLLSKRAEGHLADTLQLAANSLKSEVWAIRNCGLLLLRSLIDALLGTGESKAAMESGWDGHTIRISYNKYPSLPGVILGLLRSAEEVMGRDPNSGAAEAVFPALDIIRRAGPPEEYRKELASHIEAYLGSRISHVREIAARTLCTFLLRGDWVTELEELLIRTGEDPNRTHGTMLTAKFVIERKLELDKESILGDAERVYQLMAKFCFDAVNFRDFPDIIAAYHEIRNLLISRATALVSEGRALRGASLRSTRRSALLDVQLGLKQVQWAATSRDTQLLEASIQDGLDMDENTACRLLESIPAIWEPALQSTDAISDQPIAWGICWLYAKSCKKSTAPEFRALAVSNLGSILDKMLNSEKPAELLLSPETLMGMWESLQEGVVNPALSCAMIQTSGAVMAALAIQQKQMTSDMYRRLRNWGSMIADALDVDNTFDTRYAAAMALKSFLAPYSSIKAACNWDDSFLVPIWSALYDALVDDDDEIRDAAAAAAGIILGKPMVSPEAADKLVTEWFGYQLGVTEELRLHVICRMTGQRPPEPSVFDIETGKIVQGLVLDPAEEKVHKALDFDDSLFATEEQNLFIDEVRETTRWVRAFHAVQDGNREEGLRKWVEDGLRCLIRLTQEKEEEEDGPLGWTSDQHVFAMCARVLLCAGAIAKVDGHEKEADIASLLEEFTEKGRRAGVHGSLLGMASI